MGKKEPKVKRFDPTKWKFDYTKTSHLFGFRPFNIRSAAQEKMDPQSLESDGMYNSLPAYPPGISREGTETRESVRKRKHGRGTHDDEASSDDSGEEGTRYSSLHGRRGRPRQSRRGDEAGPSTCLKLRIPKAGKKKVKSDGDFFESLLDSCHKWLSPPNAVKKGIRDLEKKDVVWKEGYEHKVVILAAGVVAKKMAMKAEELLRARMNTTILQTITLGPREHDMAGNLKSEVLAKVVATIKKHDACKPKFLFLVTRGAEGVMYGLRNGITQEIADEVHTTVEVEQNSELTDIIDWRMKDIKKGLVSQHIKKGTVHGIVFCGAPKITLKPEEVPGPPGNPNEYPTFREVFRRLSDVLDTFDEPVQDGLAVEDDYIVHLKNIITAPQELLRTIGEKFKELTCDCRIIPRTPPADAEAIGLMLADLICCREFSQSPLLDAIELGNYEFPLVLCFTDGNPTEDQPAEEDRHLKIVMSCLDTLKRKQYLRGFTLLSAKFVNSKSEGVFITNEDLTSQIVTTQYLPGMWEEFNDGDNLIGFTGLDGCEYIVHVLTLFR